MTTRIYETDRLRLRHWRKSDREPFAHMNADATVMRYFPSILEPTESDALVVRIEEHFTRFGFGLWALERKSDRRFIGFTGLSTVTFDASFTPAVEVGWRLDRSAWGQGFATEAGAQALTVGFEEFALAEIVSITAAINLPSQAVMVRLGMTHNPKDDFHHPRLPIDSPLSQHVLFRSSTGASLPRNA